MNRLIRVHPLAFLLAALFLAGPLAQAQDQQAPIPDIKIQDLQSQLVEVHEAASSARKKLAIRRVIRECEGLLSENPAAPNRFEVLGVLYASQQEQIKLDDSPANRSAFLDTCRALAAAPNEYAALRLDADLLLSQADLAQQGADQQARADALKPLVQRYLGTEVQTKVVRIAMLIAIELGDASLIGYLQEVIAENFPGDMELINFQRDKLAGQVFGAPFVGTFQSAQGKTYRFPMDGMGKTTAIYFWSKEDGGVEQLKELAEGWKAVPAEKDASGLYQFISFNLDGLPDAGQSILRETGLDWPALHLPGGRDNPIYQTYVRNDPMMLTMTPTGYTAIVMSGSTRPGKDWDRLFQSALARSWSNARYTSQIQSLLAGEFLVVDPTGAFDPAAPPEWKAALAAYPKASAQLNRSPKSVPAETLHAIQACFIKPPARYRLSSQEARANYLQAEKLCRQAIAEHPDADDLWIVRNRLIVSLMALWRLDGQRTYFDAALQEATAAIEAGYPVGTGVVAHFCIARDALRTKDTDAAKVINGFADTQQSASADAIASLLALEVGDRQLHEQYRRASLDRYAQAPILWSATSFLMDRYHRYWLYHPPFTAGWTYGRRQGHFLAIETPEDANRTISLQLKTLDGEMLSFPNDSNGKWTIIEFRSNAQTAPHLSRNGTFVAERPFEDVNLIAAILDDDAEAVREGLAQMKKPDTLPTLLVPGGLNHPVVQQLGILDEDTRPNLLILRPDGSIAAFLSGLTMSAQNGNVLQQVIQWHDEQAIDEALARGDLDEARRLAFAHAPPLETSVAEPKKKKTPEISPTHLRARAKVYMAMQDWEAALADAQAAYLQINSKAGWLSMRTDELDEIEQLKAAIQSKLEAAK